MEVEIVEGEGAVLVVNMGHPIVTNGNICVRGGDAALPKLLWDFLFFTTYNTNNSSDVHLIHARTFYSRYITKCAGHFMQ